MSQESPLTNTATGGTPQPIRIADSTEESTAPSQVSSGPVTRRRLGMIAAAIALIAVAAYWVYDRLSHVNVADARVASDMISLSARIPGWISEFRLQEGQHVEPGEIIATIDHKHADLQLKESEANVARLKSDLSRIAAERAMMSDEVDARVERYKAELAVGHSQEQADLAELARAESDWNRAAPLLEQGVITREVWERMRNAYQQALHATLMSKARTLAAQAALTETQVGYRELGIFEDRLASKRHEIEEAQMQRDIASLARDDHFIRSPIAGVIDEKFVDPGEYVRRGQRLLVLHDPKAVWVKANIKETDIRHLSIGTPAKITVDAFPGELFTGRISAIGNAATSQFALLPNPNPSGNFTKITQRLEVKIEFDHDEDRLKPGMMVEVEIDI